MLAMYLHNTSKNDSHVSKTSVGDLYLLDDCLEWNAVKAAGVSRKVKAVDNLFGIVTLVLVFWNLLDVEAESIGNIADEVQRSILLDELAIVDRESPQLFRAVGGKLDLGQQRFKYPIQCTRPQ